MKVLHLIQRYPPAVGGSETWCREVARYLSAVGDQVKVLTFDVFEEEEYWREPLIHQCTRRLGRLDWDDGVLVRRYRRSLPVHVVHHVFFKVVLDRLLRVYFYGPHSVEMYGRLFSEAKAADVVHLHTMPYPHNLIGYLAARRAGKRVVITPHFHPDHPHYERWSNYWLLKRCDAVIAVSPYERDYLIDKGVDPARIIATGNGVHLEDYLPKGLAEFKGELFQRYRLSEATRLVLFIGRKLHYKGIETLVEAVKQLGGQYDVALFLVGPSSPWFASFYEGLSSKDRERIIDLGTVSVQEKVNLLHLANVLVLPSRFEAFGIVLLEAWACGIPVIGSDRGAIPSIVGDGGYTFEYGNAEDLASKIADVLRDDRMARRMARNGRRRVLERYTWGKIGAATRQVYVSAPAGRRRVLICSNLFPPHTLGGAELVAYQQAKALKALGHDVRVFCGRLQGGMLRPYRVKTVKGEFRTTCIGLTAKDLSGDQWDFGNPRVTQAFAKVLDEFAPETVHFHNLVGLSVRMIDECVKRDIPTVMTLHDYWGICFKNTMIKNDGRLCTQGGFDCLDCRETLGWGSAMPSPVRNAQIFLALSKVDQFVAPSRYLAERYGANGIERERIAVIRNGIDLERFKPAPKDNTVLTLGFIGYLGAHKGVDVLLQALSRSDCEKVRLVIVGDGVMAERLKALCRELQLERVVTFLGHVANQHIADLYAQLDALVVPSVWPENSPVTITEAMASGLPVIASDIGGIGELVEDGITGFLVPPKDSDALAERIEHLLARPDLRRQMGQRALEKIQAYSLVNQVRCLSAMYEALSGRRKDHRSPDADVVLYAADQPWSTVVREMFRQLAVVEKQLHRRLLVYPVHLAPEEVLDAAKLLLIPAAGPEALRHALRAFRQHTPILVAAEIPELRELCVLSKGGLFFAGGEELQAALTMLLSDEPLRTALALNGGNFVGAYSKLHSSPMTGPSA